MPEANDRAKEATSEGRSVATRTASERSSGLADTGTPLGSRPMTAGASLITDAGSTRISNGVVAKIAGLAARDIPGVFSMGTGMARRVGQIRSMIPGGSGETNAMQGVSVEVGEKEAAIDLDIVTWYGQSIVDISEAVRRNVTGQVAGMTGLKVVEVNINVDDVHVESDQPQPEQRVQ
jgi:uncharacterized alkaline shock family protein YloU